MFALFIAANVLVLIAALFHVSWLRLRTRLSFIAGIYLASISIIIISFELASLVRQINLIAVIVIQLLLGLTGMLFWFLAGRPSLLGPFAGLSVADLRNDTSSYLHQILTSKDLFILFCFLLVFWGVNILISIAIPPLNFDVLAYHLPRIIYWYQNQSFYPWETFDLRQTTSPPNAEIGLLWIFLWTKSDALFWMVQFGAMIISMLAIGGITRLLGHGSRQVLFVALIWATLSQVFYQSFSAQNDLVIACLCICMVYLFFDGFLHKNDGAVLLSAIAFGLGLGTKVTLLFLLPAWGLIVLFIYWKHANFRKSIQIWMITSVIAFVLVGSYFYIQNILYYGNLFGPSETVAIVSGKSGLVYRLELLRDNLGRYFYQSIEFGPFPDNLRIPLVNLKNAIFMPLYHNLGIDVTSQQTVLDRAFDYEISLTYVYPGIPEDAAWFGPLFILFIPVFLIRIYKTIRFPQLVPLSLILIYVLYFVVQAFLQPWTYYKSRYLIIPVSLSFAFFADLYVHNTGNGWHRLSKYLIVLVAIFTMLLNMAAHPYRAISGVAYAVRGERMSPVWERVPIYLAVKEYVPENEAIGTYYSDFYSRFIDPEKEKSFPLAGDYPLFGYSFERRVIPLRSLENIPENIDYLFVASVYASQSKKLQSDFRLLVESDNMALYQRIHRQGAVHD